MTKENLKYIKEKAASLHGCHEDELTGQTLRQVLEGVSVYGEAVIYWGCFSDDDLNLTV